MINIPASEFKTYDMTGVKHAVFQDDNTVNLYYVDDPEAEEKTLEIMKISKQRDIDVDAYKQKRVRNITVDVPDMGIGVYNNKQKDFERVLAKHARNRDAKLICNDVRTLHTAVQVECVYTAMIERWEDIVDAHDDIRELIDESKTLEELEQIDMTLP